jgi:hypothetical protein
MDDTITDDHINAIFDAVDHLKQNSCFRKV